MSGKRVDFYSKDCFCAASFHGMSMLDLDIPFQSLLQQRVAQAFVSLEQEVPSDFQVRVFQAKDPRHGDYQCNDCLSLAKLLKQNPRALATSVLELLEVEDLVETVEIAGPGFINFRLKKQALAQKCAQLLREPRLGVPLLEKQKVVLDFSSPNVAKPMHVGHIRSTFLGDSLARIARFLGLEVVTVNHIGDWGTQFGMILWGWKRELDLTELERDPVAALLALYRSVNEQAKADEAIREECKAELVRLQAGDVENLQIWQRCVDLSKQGLEQIYSQLGIEFDFWMGESAYNDQLAPLVDSLEQAELAELSDGAMVVFFADHPRLNDKPLLVRKGDGGFLYATTDLAAIDYRTQNWGADAIWYVVGAPQQLHFEQVFEASKRRGVEARLEHIAFGSILGEDRKLMRTRSGESVGLIDVLEEGVLRAKAVVEEKNSNLSAEEVNEIAEKIGIGAIKYAELSQNRLTDYVFSWDKMLSLQGRTAPYLQNSYVRICSIFRKAEADGVCLKEDFGSVVEQGTIELGMPAERVLALCLARYGETVPLVLEDFKPNLLAEYLFELASAFHSFYHDCPVLSAEEALRESRLALCVCCQKVLKHGLGLLGIDVPEKM